MYSNYEYVMTADGELYHYGVKGMKWGKRKALPQSDISKRYHSTKDSYRNAKKAYSSSFNTAYNKRGAAYSPIKKHRAENDARWEDALNKRDAMLNARAEYKSAYKTRKEAIKSTHRDLNKKATLGEKLTYNDATRKKAAKYIVDNNMSVADATKKAKGDAWRNSAILVGAYAAVTVATLYKNR